MDECTPLFYGGVEGALGDADEAEIEWFIQAAGAYNFQLNLSRF